MIRILVIGIGSGGEDLLTLQAVDALRRADVFFVFDKGSEKDDLVQMRKAICARYCNKPYRFIELPNPPRDKVAPYRSGVDAWHAERALLAGAAMRESLLDEQTGAFLVWGDPSLYDSTLRILDMIKAAGAIELDYEVVPGVSSLQVLAARHRICLNAIGEPVLVTTGRKLAQAFPAGQSSIAVFLDDGDGLRSLADRDAIIYWGAYLGSADEILVSGRLVDVLERILELRAALRKAKGWIFDIYVIRSPISPA